MAYFNIGDLIEFIPENFNRNQWSYCLIGVGLVEDIVVKKIYINNCEQEINTYKIYCGKVIKQQVKNFAEWELLDKTFYFTDSEVKKICRKATLD